MGSGKSGAFIIASLIRIDTSVKKTQVIILGHSRELVIQLSRVIKAIINYAPEYIMCNAALEPLNNSAHIIISTPS
jgi:superfamily II DNA/RNA helicase